MVWWTWSPCEINHRKRKFLLSKVHDFDSVTDVIGVLILNIVYGYISCISQASVKTAVSMTGVLDRIRIYNIGVIG